MGIGSELLERQTGRVQRQGQPPSAQMPRHGGRPAPKPRHVPPERSRILVVGLARNVAEKLDREIRVLSKALSFARSVSWFVVESDSSDDTVEALKRCAATVPSFRFVSLGALEETLPSRTRRIAHCRNVYLEEIRRRDEAFDYVVVTDLDGINSHLSRDAILSCWGRTDWDGCTANQLGPYYDIWALRHPMWCPHDCWEQQRFLEHHGGGYFRIRLSLFLKMIRIPPQAPWIEVDSSFGGLALYRRDALMVGHYSGEGLEGRDQCEHVALHEAMRANGARLFINPQMINAGVTDHVSMKAFVRRAVKGVARKLPVRLTRPRLLRA